ncbi:hypothetical protein Agub_g12239 [Astrephomene gubernaculifera]|uniref:Uncharacterized protein n=1 Tax=Astrephomene gubernaculifera TaxID=47775 RepID=A0AAD3DZY1_9CHLO|nr:hypothetical protein Agub_g12239 [Astrephomene gubernaculifera]
MQAEEPVEALQAVPPAGVPQEAGATEEAGTAEQPAATPDAVVARDDGFPPEPAAALDAEPGQAAAVPEAEATPEAGAAQGAAAVQEASGTVQDAPQPRSTGGLQQAHSSGLRVTMASDAGAVEVVGSSSAMLGGPLATTTESSLASAYSSAVPGALSVIAPLLSAEERSLVVEVDERSSVAVGAGERSSLAAAPSEGPAGGEGIAGGESSAATAAAAPTEGGPKAVAATTGGAGVAAERQQGDSGGARTQRSGGAAGPSAPLRAQVQVVEAPSGTDRRASERTISPQVRVEGFPPASTHRPTATPSSRSGSSYSTRRPTPTMRPTSVEGHGYRPFVVMPELAVVGATAATAISVPSASSISASRAPSAHDDGTADRSPGGSPHSSPSLSSEVVRGSAPGQVSPRRASGSPRHVTGSPRHGSPKHVHPHFHIGTRPDLRPLSADSESSAVDMSPNIPSANRSGPLVMPFSERRAIVATTEAYASPSISPPPSVGRRPPNHGSVRHGPAHTPPLLSSAIPPTVPASAAAAGPQRPVRPDASGTADGAADVRSALQRIPTRDREKSTSRPSHAAGGGAAAVKAAAAAAATGSGSFKGDPTAGAAGKISPANAGGVQAPPGSGKGQATAATAVAVSSTVGSTKGGASKTSQPGVQQHQQQQQERQLIDVMQIKSIHKAGVAPGLDPPSVSMSAGAGQAGVPGRRGRRIGSNPTKAAANAAATAAYFAGLEAAIAAGTAGGKALLPTGLARKLREARITSGPQPFQRRKERQPPPSPAGVKLDGFMLLEAADEEMPEAVLAASLESRLITEVESADLSYFVALRDLDVSDNKLPDLACLLPLQALMRLRAASCRLRTLGRWPGFGITTDGAAEGSVPGSETPVGAAPPPAKTPTPVSVLKRQRTRTGAPPDLTGAPDAMTATLDAVGGVAIGPAAAAAAATAAAATASSATGTGGGSVSGGIATPTASFTAGHVSFAASRAVAGSAPTPDPVDSALVGMQPVAGLLLPQPMIPNPFRLLEVLDLSYNHLQAHMVLLPGSPLALLPRLAELDLSANRFRTLPSPSEILMAAAVMVTGDGASSSGAPLVAFPALRRLRLSSNGLKGPALASLAALAPPCLAYLDLSHNAISDSPRLHLHLLARPSNRYQLPQASPPPGSEQQLAELLGAVLPQLAVVDLTYNRVAAEAAVGAVLQLPGLQRLLLAGNPLATTAQRTHVRPGDSATSGAAFSPKIDFGAPDAAPARPTVAGSLTARFARIAEEPPKQQASTLAAAAAAAITAAAAPERVTEAFDRMDATIEQWRLNTVMEEDEEEEDEDYGDEGGEDRTFLTGIGIQERRRRGGRPDSATDPGEDGLETVVEDAEQEAELDDNSSHRGSGARVEASDDRPLWESITDPTERLAVALGLDPLVLPMHTGALTSDSAGAISALRFALAHPLVEADDGLAPHPRYATTTTAAQLKRKPRRPMAAQRLAPMAAAATAAATAVAVNAAAGGVAGGSPRAAKIQTVETMLEGMKGKLAALEASLAAHLASAPAPAPAEAVQKSVASRKGRYSGRRAAGSDTDSEDAGDDSGSTGSGLPDDVIDQIERESESDMETEGTVDEVAEPLDPMQGIVLLAEQIVQDEQTVGSATTSTAGNLAQNASQSPTIGLVSSQASRSVMGVPITPQSHQPSPTRGSGSPQRVGASAGGAGVRKGANTAQVPVTPVAVPNGAASALGYAL